MYVELTAYQLLTLETKVLGIAFAGGGVETAAVVVAIVRRREAAARRGRGSDCMMTKKSGLRCERPFTAPTGPASAAATWMPSLTRPSSLGQRRSEVPKSILRYTLSRKSTGIKTAFKQTGHIQIDCITNLQTTCSPMCRSKLQTRGVNHNLIAIVSFATSYAFIAATAGQLVATGRAQLSVANANSAGILQEVYFRPCCGSPRTVDSSQRGTSVTMKLLRAEGWASHGPSVECLECLETNPRRPWVYTGGGSPVLHMPLAIPLTLL